MASKLNSEFNYRTQVMGETPWAKIKTLRGFLEGRIRAAAMEEVAEKRLAAARSELQDAKGINAKPHVILRLEADLLEIESGLPTQTEAFELNRQEIKTIQDLIAEYLVIAESTRIPGYTDEQMFEANAENEFTAMIVKDIYSEILANGRPSPSKMRNAMSSPHTLETLKSIGLINKDVKLLISDVSVGTTLLTFKEE